jgi:hypothetical protein
MHDEVDSGNLGRERAAKIAHCVKNLFVVIPNLDAANTGKTIELFQHNVRLKLGSSAIEIRVQEELVQINLKAAKMARHFFSKKLRATSQKNGSCPISSKNSSIVLDSWARTDHKGMQKRGGMCNKAPVGPGVSHFIQVLGLALYRVRGVRQGAIEIEDVECMDGWVFNNGWDGDAHVRRCYLGLGEERGLLRAEKLDTNTPSEGEGRRQRLRRPVAEKTVGVYGWGTA